MPEGIGGQHSEGQPPFRGELSDAGLGREWLQQLTDDQDHIVRRDDRTDSLQGGESLPDSEKMLVTTKKELEDLREFGVAVPDFNFIFGHGEDGKPAVFNRVERVTGLESAAPSSLPDQWEFIPPEVTSRTLVGLAHYYQGRIKHDQPYLDDLASNWQQFVYGVTPNNPQPDLYLVDLDPYISAPEDRHDSQDVTSQVMLVNILNLYTEAKRGYSYGLPAVREAIRALMDTVDEVQPFENINWKFVQNQLGD